MKAFNTAGTCRPNEHYMVDITDRLETIRKMVAKGDYFCINRGRQYGKTTTLEAISNRLSDEYCVFKISFEGADDSAFETAATANANFLKRLHQEARWTNKEEKVRTFLDEIAPRGLKSIDDVDFRDFVAELCETSTKPIVVLNSCEDAYFSNEFGSESEIMNELKDVVTTSSQANECYYWFHGDKKIIKETTKKMF